MYAEVKEKLGKEKLSAVAWAGVTAGLRFYTINVKIQNITHIWHIGTKYGNFGIIVNKQGNRQSCATGNVSIRNNILEFNLGGA